MKRPKIRNLPNLIRRQTTVTKYRKHGSGGGFDFSYRTNLHHYTYLKMASDTDHKVYEINHKDKTIKLLPLQDVATLKQYIKKLQHYLINTEWFGIYAYEQGHQPKVITVEKYTLPASANPLTEVRKERKKRQQQQQQQQNETGTNNDTDTDNNNS
jgi:hypothetical protein